MSIDIAKNDLIPTKIHRRGREVRPTGYVSASRANVKLDNGNRWSPLV